MLIIVSLPLVLVFFVLVVQSAVLWLKMRVLLRIHHVVVLQFVAKAEHVEVPHFPLGCLLVEVVE